VTICAVAGYPNGETGPLAWHEMGETLRHYLALTLPPLDLSEEIPESERSLGLSEGSVMGMPQYWRMWLPFHVPDKTVSRDSSFSLDPHVT
jgi:hypothetical protein